MWHDYRSVNASGWSDTGKQEPKADRTVEQVTPHDNAPRKGGGKERIMSIFDASPESGKKSDRNGGQAPPASIMAARIAHLTRLANEEQPLFEDGRLAGVPLEEVGPLSYQDERDAAPKEVAHPLEGCFTVSRWEVVTPKEDGWREEELVANMPLHERV